MSSSLKEDAAIVWPPGKHGNATKVQRISIVLGTELSVFLARLVYSLVAAFQM